MKNVLELGTSWNGVNGTDGKRLFEESGEEVARLACGATWEPRLLEELRRWHELGREAHLDTRFGIDPRRLQETGWGVVFAADTPPEVREALAPLLELRRAQAGEREERYYRELVYREGESKLRFLARHGTSPGPADPERLPYYLLLVGGPEAIPFRFQYHLDVQYAVGRISFDTAEEYARYAESVVAAEEGRVVRPRRWAFFGVTNGGDDATTRSRNLMVLPLADHLEGVAGGWSVDRVVDITTKARLAELLGGERTPAFLFTASHGMGFQEDDPRLLSHQGAFLCQDWPGPGRWEGKIPTDQYFSADDVGDDADVSGLITFHFACFGAGTPSLDGFSRHRDGKERRRAPRDFLSRLPQRLLGHPRGGALACVGHVDRAWTYAFDWPRAGVQVQVFENAFERLLAGYPVGAAMEYFGQRYAELASDLNDRLEDVEYGAKPDLLSLAGLWTTHNDARSYIVLGDPAVRLPGAVAETEP